MPSAAESYQFSSYIKETSSSGATFLEKVFTEIKDGLIAESAQAGAKADAFMKDCLNMAGKAKTFEEMAITAGDMNSAKLYAHMANEFDRLAGDRFASSAEEYLAKAANYSKAGLAKVASAVGPISDAIKLGNGAVEIVTSGDGTKLGEATYDILGSMVGAFFGGMVVAGIAAGTVFLGVPVAAGTVGAGIIIGAFAVAGGLGGEALWKPISSFIDNTINKHLPNVFEWANSLSATEAAGVIALFPPFAAVLGIAKFFSPENGLYNKIVDKISSLFSSSQTAVQVVRCDPLTLDLDNDGLETVGINTANPILFDHDGDGVKTATGWVKADDAFLVLDRNGNGTIDNGAELFGDSTPLAGGGTAADGFAALAQEDTNGDGLVDANDARFANLRVWQDLNQDGVSQANELKTLAEAGISAINVAKTENSQLLSNGNQLADLGAFIRSDGSTGGLGEITAQMGDIDLAVTTDGTYNRFADNYADILGRKIS